MNHVNAVKKTTNKLLAAVTPTHANALSNVLVVIVAPILIAAKPKAQLTNTKNLQYLELVDLSCTSSGWRFFYLQGCEVSRPGHHGEF